MLEAVIKTDSCISIYAILSVLMCLDTGNSWMTSSCETDFHHFPLISRGLPVGSSDVPVIYLSFWFSRYLFQLFIVTEH